MKKQTLTFMVMMTIGSATYSQTPEKLSQQSVQKTKQTSVVKEKQYHFKTEISADNSWGYLILNDSKVIFRSSNSHAHPNKFTTEKDAISAAENKINELNKVN